MAYEDRVRRGAALLDRERPGWAHRIATDRLAMESCSWCILGQLYGSYSSGWIELLTNFTRGRLFYGSEHGFTLPEEDQDRHRASREVILRRFAALADAWRAAIRERRDAANSSDLK